MGLGRMPVMTACFLFALIGVPVMLMQAVAVLSNRLVGIGRSDKAVRANIARFATTLIPLSIAMWLAHYCFHLVTTFDGWRTATARAFADWTGAALEIGPITMACCKADSIPWLLPAELIVLGVGMAVSFVVAYRLSGSSDLETVARTKLVSDRVIHPRKAAIPWVLLMLVYYAACVWVLLQPMQMRGAI